MVPNDKDSVELDNYYTGEKITIPLNVALTPNQNAQRYFKKYQKLKEAVKHLTGLIEETKQTIDYLEVWSSVFLKPTWMKSRIFVRSLFRLDL